MNIPKYEIIAQIVAIAVLIIVYDAHQDNQYGSTRIPIDCINCLFLV